jgi:hypothetical protein
LTTAELASEILSKTSLLASSAPEAAALPNELPVDNVILVGPWGDGSEEISLLKKNLATQGFAGKGFKDTLELTAADPVAARDVPLNQHLRVVRTYHGVSINGFSQTESLRERYLNLRDGGRPLHIFPEEQAASLMEKEMQALIRSGKLSGAVELFGPEGVSLAREGRLLRQVALLVASQRLIWHFDPLDQSGQWQLVDGQSAPIPVVAGKSPNSLLSGLLDHMSRQNEPSSQRILDALDGASREVGGLTEEGRARLVRIADGTSDQVGVADQSDEARLLLSLSGRSLLES